MDEGINKLAKVIHGRIDGCRQAYSDLVLDTGTIQPDMSLLTDSYPIPIPQKDYFVNELLTLGETDTKLTKTETDGTHSHPDAGSGGEHSHTVLIPEKMRWLKPGDRVLVAWVQYDAFVIMRFLPASVINM